MTFAEAVPGFLAYCQEQKLSPHTLRGYETSLREFPSQQHPIRDLNRHHVQEFVRSLSNSDKHPSTIRTRIAALSSFFDWAVGEGVADINVARKIRTPKIPRRLPKFIPRIELEEHIEGVKGDDFISLRNRAILEMGYAGAMRVSDLQRANFTDLDLKGMRVRVVGKGNKEAWVTIGESAVTALVRYLKKRRDMGIALKDKALFVTDYGDRLCGIAKIVRAITGKGPHVAFRSSGATHWHLAGADMREIQQHLRHANLSTTQRYVGMEDSHFRDQYFSRYPRARRKEIASP